MNGCLKKVCGVVDMDFVTERAAALAKEFPGVKKVALSYSGGLDSAVIGVLLSKAGYKVFPVVVNIGQRSDLGRVEKNAKKMFGECIVADARESFVQNIARGIKSNCYFEGHINASGLARPALAMALVHEARSAGCQAIAHGSSGVGNDHLSMENAVRVLAPELRVMAPVRDLDLRRDETLDFAKKEKLSTNLLRAEKYSADENLWARTVRQGEAIDPAKPVPEDVYVWTTSPRKAPAKPTAVDVEFSNGVPVAASIDGKRHERLADIIAALNETGGRHGVGRLDALDDKVVGLKIREIYECPAAMILLAAHRELELITLTTKELEVKRYVDGLWNRLVHDAGWYTRLRRDLDAFIDQTQHSVDGSVALQLYKGNMIMCGRKSRHALYDMRLSARDSDAVFSQKDARHFAKLYGLQDVIAYMIDVD